jgi:hypothetical protein
VTVSKGSIPTADIVSTAAFRRPVSAALRAEKPSRLVKSNDRGGPMPALSHRNANAAPARLPKRPRVRPSRRDWIAGTLVELDPAGSTITVRVDSGGRPHPARGAEVAVDVALAGVRATDGDGDGRPGLTDLFPGDRVHVTLRQRRPHLPIAMRVRQQSAGAPPGGLRPIWATGRA